MNSSVLSRNMPKGIGVESAQTLLIVGLVLGTGLGLFVLGLSGGPKYFVVAAGLGLAVLGAFVSGNPRLFCLWGLMLTIPLTLSKRFGPMFLGRPGGEDSFRIEISDVFLVALAGFILWELLTERRKGLRIPKVTFLWLMLVAIGCAWIINGPWRTSAAQEVVRMLKVTALFLVVSNELTRPGRIRHCLAGLTLAAFGESVIALMQYHKKGLFGLQEYGEASPTTIHVLATTSVQGESVFRPSGLLEHANLLGVFLAVTITLAVAMLMVSRRASARAFFLAAIAVAIPAEIVTMSRSAWACAGIALGLFFVFSFLHPRLRWRSLVTSSVVVLVGLVILAAFSGPIVERLLNSKDDSTVAREIYKADAKRMIAAAPWFGLGLNSYVLELPNYSTLAMKDYGDQPPAVHNIFYLWWAETGIFGMLIFCAVWGSIIYTGFANLGVRDEVLFAVNAACLGAMIGLIPDSFLSFTLRVNTMLRLYWLLAGLIMAVRYMRLQEKRDRSLLRMSDNSMAAAAPEVVLTPR